MGDIGDYWREHRDHRNRDLKNLKLEQNKRSSIGLLKKKGIQFESLYEGDHLVVSANGRVFDFWPATGKWQERGVSSSFRGVRELITEIES